MRNLLANNRQLWYALYQGRTEKTDTNGDYTGEWEESYAEPVAFKASLSATRGTQGFTGTGVLPDYFGVDVDYALIISTADMTLPIDEHTLIWDVEPTVVSGSVDYSSARYDVTAVARGLVQMKYAIRRRPETEVL